jgi:hypothetical protein
MNKPCTWVFNFQKQFAARVRGGHKRQTIRKHRTDGRMPKIGDRVNCYTGLRTSGAIKLLEQAPIINVQPVELQPSSRQIWVGAKALTAQEAHAFALADGFETLDELFKFFDRDRIAQDFSGFLTVWDPLAVMEVGHG